MPSWRVAGSLAVDRPTEAGAIYRIRTPGPRVLAGVLCYIHEEASMNFILDLY